MNSPAPRERIGAISARWLAFALTALLAACGGGGGGGSTAATTTTTTTTTTPTSPTAPTTPTNPTTPTTPGTPVVPVATLALTAFTPVSGPIGSTITVTGAGFTTVQSVKLGTLAATYTVASDTQLQLVVPAGAQSGRIQLDSASRTVVSATDFTVSSVPLLTSLTPTTVLAGGRVTLAGANLDRVAQVRVNATNLTLVSQSSTAITADVPLAATSGTITFVEADGTVRPQSQSLTVLAPMTLASFSPTSIVTGQALTINGTNLDRATGVVFAGGATAPVATRTGTTRFTVTVPDAATTGALQVQGNAGDVVTSASALTVIPAIRVDATAVYRVAAAGTNVTVSGSGLTEVSGVTVQGLTATVVSKTATQLVFTVPPGFACGPIVLQSASQPAVAGGSVIVGNGCGAALAGIEFAQVLSQGTNDVRQRLVPGKETWLRAFVVSSSSGIAAPTVRVTGYRGATILGTVAMAGPATLPVAAGGTVTDAIRYDEAQSFNALLPATWVASGLSVRVEVDPEQRLGPMITQDATPTVGSQTKVDIVLVPLVSGAYAPTVPSVAAVLDELTRRFPIPRDRITVSTRASYTLTSVTDGLDTSTEWSNALSELNQLRSSENPSNPYRYYFGFVQRSGGSIAGIGYVPGRAAIGWDSSSGWPRTMSHEVGHNFGRSHAPCGGVASPDPNYPYTGGVLNATPLVDSIPAALDVISPAGQYDIMGYCSGAWFSDYNYQGMQTYLESLPQADVALAQSATVASDLLLVSGTIGADGVTFRPVHALRSRAPVAATGPGEYTLRLVTRDGRTIEQPFDADLVDHAEPAERQFSVVVADPGTLDRLEVRHGATLLPVPGTRATAQRARAPSNEPLTVDWSESTGQLSVRWNAASAQWASATYVVNGERRVLALQRQGGALVADTAGLPPGGEFELSFTDGVNARLVTVRR